MTIGESSQDGKYGDEAQRKKYSGPALRAFFNVASHLNLEEQDKLDLLCLDSQNALDMALYQEWQEFSTIDQAELDEGTLDRIANVIRIYGVLGIMTGSEENAEHWLKTGNKHFDGQKPLDVMRSEDTAQGLHAVRDYLLRFSNAP